MEVGRTENELQAVEASEEKVTEPTPALSKKDLIGAITSSPAFIPGLLVALGIALVLLPLWPKLYDLWMQDDGYYSHGFLIPFISGYVVYRWWPWLKEIPVKPFYFAAVPLIGLLYVTRIASLSVIDGLMAVALMGILLLGVWFVAGGRWMLALAAPILYLGFALPLWTTLINDYTNPLQIVSTGVSFELLNISGFKPLMVEPTVIYLNNFQLNVEVPCSGLKLVVALTAFTFFFVLIAKLKPWANFFMVALILPLAIFINGLRIALIGVVGDTYGHDAGIQFHDYSGYVTLLVCFVILFKIAKVLGWKD